MHNFCINALLRITFRQLDRNTKLQAQTLRMDFKLKLHPWALPTLISHQKIILDQFEFRLVMLGQKVTLQLFESSLGILISQGRYRVLNNCENKLMIK